MVVIKFCLYCSFRDRDSLSPYPYTAYHFVFFAACHFPRSGAWLVPNSTSNSLNVMKTFATVLMLGQIAEEFHEISHLAAMKNRESMRFFFWEVNWEDGNRFSDDVFGSFRVREKRVVYAVL